MIRTVFVPRGDFVSIVRHLPAGYSTRRSFKRGCWSTNGTRSFPNRIETTGIAVHYNQPNTEPPQCVLLAVSPTIKGRWEWDDLVETLIDTFDRARRRAVEPDFLRTTPYAQLLPAGTQHLYQFSRSARSRPTSPRKRRRWWSRKGSDRQCRSRSIRN